MIHDNTHGCEFISFAGEMLEQVIVECSLTQIADINAAISFKFFLCRSSGLLVKSSHVSHIKEGVFILSKEVLWHPLHQVWLSCELHLLLHHHLLLWMHLLLRVSVHVLLSIVVWGGLLHVMWHLLVLVLLLHFCFLEETLKKV